MLLLRDLKKLFIRDFYVCQLDRNGYNFIFKETTNSIRLAPLYNYENSFESCTLEKYRNQIGEINLLNDRIIILVKKKFATSFLYTLTLIANFYHLIIM